MQQLLVAVVEHPQLTLVLVLVEQTAEEGEVRGHLPGLGLAERVAQLHRADLTVVRQSVARAVQAADLVLRRPIARRVTHDRPIVEGVTTRESTICKKQVQIRLRLD